MAVIKVPGPISGKLYSAKIAGDSPTVDEQKRIDAFVSQAEQAFQTKYTSQFGAPVETGESSGVLNYLGEIPKGIARGAVNFGESALLGAAAALPESWEDWARSGIRRGAYELSPQSDIGLEGSLSAKLSEGIGSMTVPYALSMVPFAGVPLAAGASMLAGAGEASENARAAGATPEQRTTSAALGLIPGAFDILPVVRLEKALGAPIASGIKAVLGRAVVQGGIEGAQETAQQIAQNLIAKGVYDPEKDIWANTGESAGLGGGTGALVSLLTELIPGRRRGAATTDDTPPATPPAEETQLELPLFDRPRLQPGQEEADLFGETVQTPRGPQTEEEKYAAWKAESDAAKAEAAKAQAEAEAAAAAAEAAKGTPAAAPTAKAAKQKKIVASQKAKKAATTAKKEPAVPVVVAPPVEEVQQELFPTEETGSAPDAADTVAPPIFTAPVDTATYETMSDAERDAYTSQGFFPPPPPSLAPKGKEKTTAPAAAVVDTSGVKVNGVDEAIANGVGTLGVTENGVAVPFDKFALSVDGNTAEVGFVERKKGARKGIGQDAYVALGNTLAEKGITLQSSTTLQAPGLALWKRLEKQGMAKFDPQTKRFSFVTPTAQAVAETTAAKEEQDAQGTNDAAVGAGVEDIVQSTQNDGLVTPPAGPATGSEELVDGGLDESGNAIEGVGTPEGAQPSALGSQPATSTQGAALETALTRAATLNPNPAAISPTPTTAPQTATADYSLVRDYEERKRAEAAADNADAQQALDVLWKSNLPTEFVDDFESWQPQGDELIRRPDLTTATDKDKVRDLATPKSNKGVGTRAEKDAAKNYFSKYRRPVDALYHMAEDIVGKVPGKRSMPDADPSETAFYAGTGESAATQAKSWVSKNLSPETNAAFDRMLTTVKSPKSRGRVISERRTVEAQKELRAATEEQIALENADTAQVEKGTKAAIGQAAKQAKISLGFVPPNLMARMQEVASILEQRLTTYAQSLLSNGNLRAVLHGIAHSSSDPRLAKLAMKMRTLVKDTQVRMVDTLSSPDGRTMAAAYDPATDTILFNRSAPNSMTNVTVLHEVVHAITHKALNKPGLPITQQLNKLFAEAQKAIGTDTVGMNNIHEFVAEAFTNKMFRDMLQASYPNAGKFSAWDRFKNAVANFIRRIFGAPAKVLGSPMDDLDMHLDQLLDTSSDVTGPRPDPGQGLLYRASNDPKELTGAMARMFREEQKFGEPTKSFRSDWANRAMALYTNSKGLLSKGVLGFGSLLQVADTANAAKITDAYDLYDAVTRLEASTIESDREVQAALIRMQEWVKKFPQQRSTLNKIVAFSTINQVDPEKTRDVYTQYWLKYDPSGEFKDGVQYKGYKTAAERDAKLKELRDKYGKGNAKSGANANIEKAALHDEMQASWRALGPEGQAIYNLMRLTYRKQFMAMRDAVGRKIDFALGEDSNLAKSIKSNIYERFFDFRSLEPYFPLVRKGEYWMAYTVYDPVTEQEEEVKETFQTRAERDRVRALLATEVPGVRIGADGQPEVRMYEDNGLKRKRIGAPETTFVRDVLSALVANKVSDKAQNEISQLFIDALPETSFARAIKSRSGVRGFESDALEAFRLKAFTLGRQAARYPFMQKVQEIRDKIAAQGIDATDTLHWLNYDPTGKFDGQEKFESFKTAKERDEALKALRAKYGANNAKSTGTTTVSKGPVHTALIKELVMRADNAMNPAQGAWQEVAKAANQFAFTYTLGLNVSSALVNLSAVPIVMVPYLSGKYGLANTTRNTRAAYKLFLNSGFNTNLTTATGDVVNVKATPSIDNYFELKDVNGKMEYVLRTDLNLSEAQKKQMQDMLPLVKLAAAQGLLSRSLTYDTLGIENFGQNKNMLDKLSMLQGLPFHMVERSNRQVSLMASYQMELDRLRKNPTEAEKSLTDAEKQAKAAEAAAYMTAEMHGTHTLSAAPRYAQSGLGRIALMFKSYGLNIAYMQFKMLKQGCANLFPGEDAEARALRNTAFKQLMGLQLSTALVAGVSGVPLYGLFRMVANMFLGDDEEDADMLARKAMGEWAFRGPLTEALGIDISSRTGLNDLLFRANPYANKQSNADFLAALIGGPAWSTGNQFLSGLTEMKKAALGQGGDFQRGLENMLPPLPRNTLQAIRFASEGARTRRNDPVLNELSPGQIMWKITGFKPTELAQREEVTRGFARMDKATAQEKTMLLNRLNLAMSQGDRNEVAEVRQDIREYNEKVRATRPKMQITADTIKSSGKSFERVSERTHNGVTFNPATEAYFTTLLRDYGIE